MRHEGTLEDWNDERGFGFIEPKTGGQRIFVHVSAFGSGHRRPQSGDLVVYRTGRDAKGRTCAVAVLHANHRSRRRRHRRREAVAIVAPLVFAVVVVAAALVGRLPWAIVGACGVVSVVTFLAYAIDKSAAVNGRRRTSESTLHLLSIAGGWPGALLGQRYLRHKSRKRSFQLVFWVTVSLNCAALYWFATAPGANARVTGIIEALGG